MFAELGGQAARRSDGRAAARVRGTRTRNCRSEPILGVDESPTKEANRKSWLWTAVAKKFSLFAIRPTREATGLTELLGAKFKGVVNCDRAKMYFQLRRTQWCWAHLQRDFQALIDRGTKVAQRLGQDLLRPVRELFRLWAELPRGR